MLQISYFSRCWGDVGATLVVALRALSAAIQGFMARVGDHEGTTPSDMARVGDHEGTTPSDMAHMGDHEGTTPSDMAHMGDHEGTTPSDMAHMGDHEGTTPSDMAHMGDHEGTTPSDMAHMGDYEGRPYTLRHGTHGRPRGSPLRGGGDLAGLYPPVAPDMQHVHARR
jgi:hypothetical protein